MLENNRGHQARLDIVDETIPFGSHLPDCLAAAV
jgi:hypothetical protein